MSAAEISDRLARCASLHEVIMALRGTPWTVSDVVIQDEFTHDVVIGAAGCAGAIVLDCT
jgi:hypothetical protein